MRGVAEAVDRVETSVFPWGPYGKVIPGPSVSSKRFLRERGLPNQERKEEYDGVVSWT